MSYQHNAYKSMSHMVSKTHQVVMLYDGAIRFCMQARDAIEKNDIQTRYNSLTKACDIITGLQLCLDFENGGEVAKLLYDYYAGLDMRLLMVHQTNDIKLVDSCIDNLKVMREAWVDVDSKASNENISEAEIASSNVYGGDEALTYRGMPNQIKQDNHFYPESLLGILPGLTATA